MVLLLTLNMMYRFKDTSNKSQRNIRDLDLLEAQEDRVEAKEIIVIASKL